MIGNENLGDWVGESHPALALVNTVACGAGSGTGPGKPFIAGRYMFVPGNTASRVEAFDIDDRDAPVYVGFVATTGNAGPNWIEGRGKHIFILNSNTGTIQVVDVSNPAAMVTVQTFALSAFDSGPQRMDLRGRYLVVGGGPAGANLNKSIVIDTANPAALVELGSVTLGSTHRHTEIIDATHVAVASRDTNTLYIVDISNPAAPAVAGSLLLSGTLTPLGGDPNFSNGRPYVYAIGYGDGKFYVVDCVDPANPRKVGETTIALFGEDVVIVGRYAFVSTRSSYVVEVVDVAFPGKPVRVQSLVFPGTPRMDRLTYSNGRLYVPDQANGQINVVKISGGKSF